MAPRRGGSSSHGISVGSVNNRCSDTDAFADGYSIGYETIDAIFLAASFVITYLWWIRKKKIPQVQALLPGWTFGFALFFLTVGFIVDLIQYTLVQCAVETYTDYYRYDTIATWFTQTAILILFAILVFKIIPHMFRAVGMSTFIPTVALGVLYGLVVILTIVWLSLYTDLYVMIAQSYFSFYGEPSIVWPERRTIAAEAWFAFFLAIAIGAGMIMAMMRMKKTVGGGPYKFWIPFFAFTLIGSNFINVVNALYYTIGGKTSSQPGYLVNTAFTDLFVVLPFLALLLLVSCPQMAPTTTTTTNETTEYGAVAAKPDMSSENTAYQPVPAPQYQPPPQNGYYHNGVHPQAQAVAAPAPVQQTYAHYELPSQQHAQPQNQWGGYNPVSTQPTGEQRW